MRAGLAELEGTIEHPDGLTLARLLQRLPPSAPPPIDWADAERRLGTPLPADVKALVDAYGPGPLGGLVKLFSPQDPRPERNLVVNARLRAGIERDLGRPVFPEPGGLLTLASDGYGRPLWWRTGGAPDRWPLIGSGAELSDRWELELPLAELLLLALDDRAPVPLPRLTTAPPTPSLTAEREGTTVAQALAEMPARRRDPDAAARLRAVLAPPSPGPTPADWPAFEAALAIRLPPDFKALADAYGTGEIDALLSLYGPSGGPGLLGLGGWMRDQLEIMRETQDFFRDPLTDEPAHRVWPEPGGLLPWADTGDAIVFHWYTSDAPPERWPVVVERGDALVPDFWAFDGSASELLVAILTRTVEVPQLDGYYTPADPPRFRTIGG